MGALAVLDSRLLPSVRSALLCVALAVAWKVAGLPGPARQALIDYLIAVGASERAPMQEAS